MKQGKTLTSVELERLGGTVLELPQRDWAVLAKAA